MSLDGPEIKPEGRMWLLVILVLLGFGAALSYFIQQNPEIDNYNQALASHPTETRSARLYTVFYNGGVFSPTNLRIHAGDSVRFENDDNQPIHVLSDQTASVPDLVGFDSIGDIPPGGSFTYTFTRTGTFGYNNLKGKTERGTVIVRP